MLAFSQANHSSSCVQEKLWLLLSTVTVLVSFLGLVGVCERELSAADLVLMAAACPLPY